MQVNQKKKITAAEQKHKNEATVKKEEIKNGFPGWLPFVLVLFTALLYSHSLPNGFVHFDDDVYIIDNPIIRDFSWHGIKVIFTSFYNFNYHPFTTIAYLFEYKFFELNPLPYHLLSVLFHSFNTLLVFKLTEQLSSKKSVALIVSLFFAIHPMHVESVAWASELKDVTYSFFYLSSLLFYNKYRDTGHLAKYYLITIMFFLAALFSKSSAVSLPVLLIAIDIYKGQSFNKKLLGEKIPLFILSLIFGIINIFSQSVGGAFNKSILHYSFINRIFLITSSISGYIIRSIIPINLSAMHLFPKVHEGFLPWEHYTSLIFLLFIILIALRRSLFQKEIIFGLCFFCITISPMLPFIPFGHALTAERYSYISYIGLFYIIGQLVSNVKIKKWKIVTITGLSIIMFIFFMQTWDRIGIWQSDTTLDDDMIKKNPDVYFGYWMRGNYEKQEGDLNDALEDYNKVILLDPGNDDAFFNRGKIYASLGNFQSAITNYSKSIQINPKDDAYNNRGWVYYRSGDMKSAILDYDKAISLNPKFIKPYFNRALIEAESGNYTEAISDYSKILKIDPENPDVYYDQGFVFLKMHDTLNACKDWEIIATRGNKQALQMMQLYCR